MIKAAGINKIFGHGTKSVHAVCDVSFSIKERERIFIHGPSGAGKSTLLHILGGLDSPTSGEVYFKEKSIYRLSDAKRSKLRNISFGFIFQFYHLLPELSVMENVMLPAMIKGAKRKNDIKREAMGLLKTVGMDLRSKHRPSQLSGGEIQRTAIARALINSPRVIFCDEPTGNLDSERGEEIYSLIRKISESSGMSVVVVSHEDIDRDFFHKEYYMKDGILKEILNGSKKVKDNTIHFIGK